MIAARLVPAAAVAACLAPISRADVGGDPERGEELFHFCSGCHQIGRGAENNIGPQLNGIFDRRAAQIEGFPYSADLERAARNGLTWNYESLDVYLTNPQILVSGTRMSFDGFEDQQDRDDVIAYLREFSANPRDIPEAAPTAQPVDHGVAPEVLAIVGDPAYGAYLSSECTSCHQESGADSGIPSITNWPAETFVIAMHAYKNEWRTHPVMNMMAGRLSDEEIAALAAYFEAIE